MFLSWAVGDVKIDRSQVFLLHQLAHLYGVEIAYQDASGCLQRAAPHSLQAALKILGAPLGGPADLVSALRERRQELWHRFCEPVVVAWDGKPAMFKVRIARGYKTGLADCRLRLKNGQLWRWLCDLDRLPEIMVAQVEGVSYTIKRIVLPFSLPWGYHQLQLGFMDKQYEILVISAPSRAYTFPKSAKERIWGVFIPLFALYSDRSWGTGTFTDLEALRNWVAGLGGNLVGTLPLLPAFLDEPCILSPYLPVSRLFWNEFYLDPVCIPEFKASVEAQELFKAPAFEREITLLRSGRFVNYRRGMAIKRKILEYLALSCLSGVFPGRKNAFHEWVVKNPAVRDYARFRAVTERRRTGWPAWPDRMQKGVVCQGDYEPVVEDYHLYAQWVSHEQFEKLADKARRLGQRLYLDLPLGVHRAGYDTWRERAIFALDADSGAPPDAFFALGQNWGFPPLHPEKIREQGYRYYIACLRHHLRCAGVLRLDHVMGLHRLFWIPKGCLAREGVYVRYRAEEFYAILALESRRYQTFLVGEDLGTVPDYVRRTMKKHKICRMYVLPFEMHPKSLHKLSLPPRDAVASLNTHDMPPFAAFWQEKKKSKDLSLPVFLSRQGWLKVPTDSTRSLLQSCLKYLAASRSCVLLINLEDLWLEKAPQNVPGKKVPYPNWQRKARYSQEHFFGREEVVKVLLEIDRLRKSCCLENTGFLNKKILKKKPDF